MGLADSYAHRFDAPARRMARAAARSEAMSQLPRFALEGLTFGVLLGLVLLLLFRSAGDLGAIVPTLGIFAFATMRLLPALQQIYHALAACAAAAPCSTTSTANTPPPWRAGPSNRRRAIPPHGCR
jgi:ATP-binding cassette, subfamily B, bacterial PglK